MKIDAIALDGETADRIAGLTLKQHAGWLRDALDNNKSLLDENRGFYQRMLAAMEALLTEYFEAPK